MVAPAIRDGRRPWLRAGVVFGGSLAWTTAVFGAMVEHELWTGASAGFGLTLVLAVLYVLSIRAGYGSPRQEHRSAHSARARDTHGGRGAVEISCS